MVLYIYILILEFHGCENFPIDREILTLDSIITASRSRGKIVSMFNLNWVTLLSIFKYVDIVLDISIINKIIK